MVLDRLQVNQKIQVARLGEGDWYASVVQDITEREVHISLPRLRGNLLVLNPGDEVEVRFFDEHASFLFPARCVGRRLESIPLYRLVPAGEARRIQQRQYVRLKCLLEVSYAQPPEGSRRPRFRRAYSLDISGGGMLLATEEELPVGQVLLLEFSLPLREGAKKMELKGRVVRSFRDEDSGKPRVALQFEEITRAQQDLIVRYIFQCMAEQARLR